MSKKLENLRSKIAQMELGWRDCSSIFLYVKDDFSRLENENKELKSKIEQIKQAINSTSNHEEAIRNCLEIIKEK